MLKKNCLTGCPCDQFECENELTTSSIPFESTTGNISEQTTSKDTTTTTSTIGTTIPVLTTAIITTSTTTDLITTTTSKTDAILVLSKYSKYWKPPLLITSTGSLFQ